MRLGTLELGVQERDVFDTETFALDVDAVLDVERVWGIGVSLGVMRRAGRAPTLDKEEDARIK